MSPEIKTFFLAMTPIGELRASLPTALTVYHLSWVLAYVISVLGNLVPVVFLLLFLDPVSRWLSSQSKIFRQFFNWFFERTRQKSQSKMRKYGYPALITFVAVPFPLTGGWTGSIIAFLFKIPFKIAFPLISLGILIAGGIVLLASQAGITIGKYFGWQVLLGVIFVILLTIWIFRLKNT